jgi:hypothetical protein
MTNINVYSSLILSVAIQAVVGIFDIIILLLKVPSKVYIIKQLLTLEVIVQIIEGSFYYTGYIILKIYQILPRNDISIGL